VGPRLSQATSYGDPAFLLVPDVGVVFGGNMQFYYNLEIEFPIVEMIGIKGVVFTDGGNAWNTENALCEPEPVAYNHATDPCTANPFILRTSWGFGIRWFSPLGPLRFEWGFPFKPLPFEESSVFEFTIGNFF
jgi:outer membrane protein insertion porin family